MGVKVKTADAIQERVECHLNKYSHWFQQLRSLHVLAHTKKIMVLNTECINLRKPACAVAWEVAARSFPDGEPVCNSTVDYNSMTFPEIVKAAGGPMPKSKRFRVAFQEFFPMGITTGKYLSGIGCEIKTKFKPGNSHCPLLAYWNRHRGALTLFLRPR